MRSELIPLFTYIIITTFTPGPNNISSATAGVQLGLKKSLGYLFGVVAGFFIRGEFPERLHWLARTLLRGFRFGAHLVYGRLLPHAISRRQAQSAYFQSDPCGASAIFGVFDHSRISYLTHF